MWRHFLFVSEVTRFQFFFVQRHDEGVFTLLSWLWTSLPWSTNESTISGSAFLFINSVDVYVMFQKDLINSSEPLLAASCNGVWSLLSLTSTLAPPLISFSAALGRHKWIERCRAVRPSLSTALMSTSCFKEYKYALQSPCLLPCVTGFALSYPPDI